MTMPIPSTSGRRPQPHRTIREAELALARTSTAAYWLEVERTLDTLGRPAR